MFGDGAVIVTRLSQGDGPGEAAAAAHSILVRVEDADRHHERAVELGARILNPPTDCQYGERQYNAEGLGGHRWTFSQSIADVDPASWGGTAVDLEKLGQLSAAWPQANCVWLPPLSAGAAPRPTSFLPRRDGSDL